MQVRESDEAGLPILQIAGEIDLNASPDLRAALLKHVEARTPGLVADFSAVEYIDSSGLATFVEYVRLAQAFKGRIVLFGLKPRVKTIFEMVRLGEIMPIVVSVADAKAALASPA